jgi:hypothetical protein
MRDCIFIVLSILLIVHSTAAASSSQETTGHSELQKEITIHLPEALENQRHFLSREIKLALDSTIAWFENNGFKIGKGDIIDSAYVFETAESARIHCAKHFGIEKKNIPHTFSGTTDQKTLFIVTSEAYEKIFKELYSEEYWSMNEYRKLIIHELAHRVHAIIAKKLFGSEDGMGPRWFFEGLAVECAGQFASQKSDNNLTWKEIKMVIEKDARNRLEKPRYPIYKQVFKSLSTKISISWLIKHAGDEDFIYILSKKFTKRGTR